MFEKIPRQIFYLKKELFNCGLNLDKHKILVKFNSEYLFMDHLNLKFFVPQQLRNNVCFTANRDEIFFITL